MKKSDVKIGEQYAQGDQWDYERFKARRVTVIGTGTVREGHYYSRKDVAAWRVKYDDGTTATVHGRTLHAPWDLYAGLREEHRARQRRIAAEHHADLVAKYTRLKKVSDAVEIAQPDRPSNTRAVYDDHAQAAREAGWTVILDKDVQNGYPAIETPLSYARSYEVADKDVALLAETVLAFEDAISDPDRPSNLEA